jgi:hypothetical protein
MTNRAPFEAAYAPRAIVAPSCSGPRTTPTSPSICGGSRADFDAFMAERRADYEALDRSGEGWTSREHRIGSYELLG